MTGDVRILSVAPRYRPGIDGAQGGHYTIYQDDLRAAAQRLGISLVVLADRCIMPSDGMFAVLDTTGERSVASSASTVVRPGDVMMVYEGSIAMVEAIAPIAAAHPASAFVVNLFRPEPGLVPVEDARVRKQRMRPATERRLPSNLIVTAETELRAELARGLGIPCAGAWRLHTTLWDVDADSVPRIAGREAGSGLRVLVPLSDRGYAEEPVRDIAYVLHRLRRLSGHPTVHLTLTGADSGSFGARTRGPRLETLGARRVTASSSRDGYSALFAEHDVVWIPHRQFYRSQSSGKTLDALAVGRPVVAAAGTWPAQESSRWVGEELSYTDPEGLVRVLLDLEPRVQEMHGRLAGDAAAIRAAYAPGATLLRVLELVAERTDWQSVERWSAPSTLPALGRAPNGIPVDGRRSQWAGALWAGIVAWRVSLIGPRERVERRVRRRLSGVRSALLRALHGAREG